MFSFFTSLFDTSDFPARWSCGNWSDVHGWLHVLSDAAIFGAYFAIPVVLAYFVVRRKDVPFLPIFWLFAAFILCCGIGHLVEATIFWQPWYRLSGLVKVITAFVSWATVIALVPIVPRALALPALATINLQLKQEIEERKRAEKRMELAVHASPSGMVMMTSAGVIVMVNARTEAMFGYAPGELIGQAIEILVPHRFRAQHPGLRQSFFQNPKARSMGVGRDLFGLRKDGTEFPVEIGLNPIETDEGLMVLSAIVDISERKEAERKLRESEEGFRLMVESVGDYAIVRLDAHGCVASWNVGAQRLKGYSADEIIGQHISQFYSDEDVQRDKPANELRLAAERGRFEDEGWRVRKDGSRFWANVILTPLRDTASVLHGFVKVTRDITERKNAEEALREKEERLRLAQQAGRIGTFEWNMQTGLNTWSPELEAMYGLPIGSFARTQPAWEQLVHSEDRAAAMGRTQRAFETGTPTEAEWRVIWPDGSVHWIFGCFQVFKDTAGKAQRLAGVNIDITERKQAEEQIRHLNADLERRVKDRTAELEAANRELEAFSYSVSHDLRAPLRAIDGFSSILLKKHASELSEKGKENLRLVRDNTQQMGRLVDDLLSFSRLSRQPVNKQPTDMAELVRQCLAELRTDQEGRRVELTVGNLVQCAAEPALLKQVWMNLLSNALKFTRKKETARLEIGCRKNDDGDMAFFVRDNGVGFDMQYAHKLFGVFQRLHRAEDYEGTGVGLAIVQRIIHRHGGKVWAEAEPGKGAAFFFTVEPARKT